MILPAMISKFNEKVLDLGYEREIKTISSAVDSLVVSENTKDFFSTMMYLDDVPESYDDSSGKFLKKYLKIVKYCGDNNGECFADKYYEYKNNKKEEYTPTYKGGCARLKNGMSICITPQIGAAGGEGLIDLNGSKGPNVFGRDLRSFTLAAKTRTGQVKDSTEVLAHNGYIELGSGENPSDTPETPEPPKSACETDNNSFDCCKTRAITGYNDACCAYTEIKNSRPECTRTVKTTTVSCSESFADVKCFNGYGYCYTCTKNGPHSAFIEFTEMSFAGGGYDDGIDESEGSFTLADGTKFYKTNASYGVKNIVIYISDDYKRISGENPASFSFTYEEEQ